MGGRCDRYNGPQSNVEEVSVPANGRRCQPTGVAVKKDEHDLDLGYALFLPAFAYRNDGLFEDERAEAEEASKMWCGFSCDEQRAWKEIYMDWKTYHTQEKMLYAAYRHFMKDYEEQHKEIFRSSQSLAYAALLAWNELDEEQKEECDECCNQKKCGDGKNVPKDVCMASGVAAPKRSMSPAKKKCCSA